MIYMLLKTKIGCYLKKKLWLVILSFNLEVKYYLKNEMYCELNSTVVMFSKSIFPLVTLSLDYHFHVCTPCMIRIRYVHLHRCQKTRSQLPHLMSHL